MYKDIFTQIGLTANEAIIYEFMLKSGETTAGEIIKNTPLKRGVVYNVLNDLVKKGLVEQKIKDKIAYFSPNHPDKLAIYLEQKEREIKKAEITLKSNLDSLISEYNLSSQKPGVRYFEGEKGLWKVLKDTLTSKEEIYTYADIEAISKYMENINNEYAKLRNKLNIKKKIIFVDSPFAQNYLRGYFKGVTGFRFIDHAKYPFSSVMQIYDGKVAYISLSEKGISSMLIHDQNIYQLNKSLFEFIWERSKTYDQLG